MYTQSTLVLSNTEISEYPLISKTATNYRLGLEQENQQLIDESRLIKQEAISINTKERALIKQCLEQFGSANRRINILSSESQQRKNANCALEDKVQELTKAVKQMQERQKRLSEENDQLKQDLFTTNESHSWVASHVLQLQSDNEEYKALLGDRESQLHDLKTKTDLNNPLIPLSTEIESALALQSTPIESPQPHVIGTNQRLVPIHRPISPLVSNHVYSTPSSDSDSHICIRDPKKKFFQSDRVSSVLNLEQIQN
ncbi:hypothetical protein LOD99_12944 [Oopsacas minuta]|uniref:HAP1 N-terminal domain-containing protein n=1 Tax=Oopsacas minuta TaxID=111878 RepID=A0AAV7JAK7_9METZ|nr:hypothetical protein LOD99_12944 [Oopsacas minuta]